VQVSNHLVQNGLHLLLGLSAEGCTEQSERLLLEVVVLGEPENAGQGGAHVQTKVGHVLIVRARRKLHAVLAARGGARIGTLGLHVDTPTTRIDMICLGECLWHLRFPLLNPTYFFSLVKGGKSLSMYISRPLMMIIFYLLPLIA